MTVTEHPLASELSSIHLLNRSQNFMSVAISFHNGRQVVQLCPPWSV